MRRHPSSRAASRAAARPHRPSCARDSAGRARRGTGTAMDASGEFGLGSEAWNFRTQGLLDLLACERVAVVGVIFFTTEHTEYAEGKTGCAVATDFASRRIP